jgi:hypothetical protein
LAILVRKREMIYSGAYPCVFTLGVNPQLCRHFELSQSLHNVYVKFNNPTGRAAMRLLNGKTNDSLALATFFGNDIPNYAILSHRSDWRKVLMSYTTRRE